jgi:hypothetical protein
LSPPPRFNTQTFNLKQAANEKRDKLCCVTPFHWKL